MRRIVAIALSMLLSGGGAMTPLLPMLINQLTATPLAVVGISKGNAGATLDRSSCVTLGIVNAVASQCGALRVAHPLPSVRTYDKERGPSLIYSSEWAAPWTIVNVDIALASGVSAPTSVRTTLFALPNGGSETQVDQRTDAGSAWSSGPQRVGLRLPTSTSAIYAYRVKVEFLVSGTWTAAADPIDGELIAVRGSIARGWRLSGVEQLVGGVSSALGWIGGDGSTRIYRPANRTTNDGWAVYVVSTGDGFVRPESLLVKDVNDTGRVVRPLAGGGRVEFTLDRHERTIGKLGEVTQFYYTNQNQVDSVTVAPVSAGLTWKLTWTTNRVTSISSPGAAGGLTTTIAYAGSGDSRITSITDPDSNVVTFTSDSDGLLTTRTDRRSTVSVFTYEANAPTLSGTKTVLDVGDTVAHAFTSMQGRAATTSTTTAASTAARSTHDGPLATGDTLVAWVNRRGAPDSTMDALGRKTRVQRDTLFYGRVTQMVAPGGFTRLATFDSRGNIATTTDVDPLGTSTNATTTFTWDQTWDLPTKVKRPLGDSSVFNVNASTGLITWAQDGADTNRVTVDYWTSSSVPACSGRYRASSIPLHAERDSMEYNALCNVVKTVSRTGMVNEKFQNRIGRDTLTAGPLPPTGSRTTMRTTYDVWGRSLESTSLGRSGTYTVPWTMSSQSFPADTLIVQQVFDDEGNLLEVLRNAKKTSSTNQGNVSAVYAYDRLNRKISDSTPGSGLVRMRYDRSGNLLWRVSPVGDSIRMEYDLLGRLIRRIEPARSYSVQSCNSVDTTSHLACGYTMPKSGSALVVPADTIVMTYDTQGNLYRIDSRFARVRRSFFPNGAVHLDTSMVRTVDSSASGSTETIGGLASPGVTADFTVHRYVLQHKYDLNGRRRALYYPGFMLPCGGSCTRDSLTFDGDGRLARVIDGRGGTYQFFTNAEGGVDSVSYPNGTKVRQRFDADGRLIAQRIGSGLYGDSSWYDWSGRLEAVRELYGAWGTTSFTYSGLGALAAMTYYSANTGETRSEEFRVDGAGQRYWARSVDYALSYNANVQTTVMDGVGRIATVTSASQRNYSYMVDGSTRNSGVPVGVGTRSDQQAYYYGSNGRLRISERRQAIAADYVFDEQGFRVAIDSAPGTWVQEEHRYDGLGRRILARTQVSGTCVSIGCESTIQRFVWDGQQLVAETQGRGGAGTTTTQLESDTTSGDGASGTPATYGQVWYTHAGGIDSPLGAIRIGGGTGVDSVAIPAVISVYPHANGRGVYAVATFSTSGGEPKLRMPGARALAFRGEWNPDDPPPPKVLGGWSGSLLNDQATSGGLNFRRNRFVDASTGRFTTVDPIGVAGGLGLYTYSGGDPINRNDPFGLCPGQRSGVPCTVVRGGQGALAGSTVGAVLGVIASPVTGPASPATIPAAAAAGGLIGSALGAAYGALEDFGHDLGYEMAGWRDWVHIGAILITFGHADGPEGGPGDVRRGGDPTAPIHQPERPGAGKGESTGTKAGRR